MPIVKYDFAFNTQTNQFRIVVLLQNGQQTQLPLVNIEAFIAAMGVLSRGNAVLLDGGVIEARG
jgi:hypothetical protein